MSVKSHNYDSKYLASKLNFEQFRKDNKEPFEKDNDMKVNNQLHRLYSEAINPVNAIKN